MIQLCKVRADEVRPGDIIQFNDDGGIMDVQYAFMHSPGRVTFYARNSDWTAHRSADSEVLVRPGHFDDDFIPLDWQDKVVIYGSVICGAACLAILVWGR